MAPWSSAQGAAGRPETVETAYSQGARPSRSAASDPAGGIAEQASALAAELVDAGRCSALSMVVETGGERALAGGWGEVDPAAREPARTDSAYCAGGLMPQLVAVAVLRLAARGELDLERPIDSYLDGLDLENPPTLVQVLRHTSGLAHEDGFFRSHQLGGPPDATRAEFLGWLSHAPPENDPGHCFSFTGTNVLLAAWVLSDATATCTLDAVLREIADPLELTGTRVSERPAPELGVRGVEIGLDLAPMSPALELLEASRLVTTAPDLVRILRALVERELLDEAGWRILAGPVPTIHGPHSIFGAGLATSPLSSHQGLTLGGAWGDCRLHAAWYPELNAIVAVAAADGDAPTAELERSVARLLFRIPEPGLHDLALSSQERAAYRGGYYVGGTRIAIEDDGEHLTASWPGGRHLVLYYQGFRIFLDRDDPEVRFEFDADETGQVLGFTLTEHGAATVARKLD